MWGRGVKDDLLKLHFFILLSVGDVDIFKSFKYLEYRRAEVGARGGVVARYEDKRDT